MDYRAVGVGIGIGLAVMAIVAFSLSVQKGTTGENPVTTSKQKAMVFLPGLVKEIRNDSLLIDQTFGHADYNSSNPALEVKIVTGTAFYRCVGEGSKICGSITIDNVLAQNSTLKGMYICADATLKDGTFYGGKIMLNATCSWQEPPGKG